MAPFTIEFSIEVFAVMRKPLPASGGLSPLGGPPRWKEGLAGTWPETLAVVLLLRLLVVDSEAVALAPAGTSFLLLLPFVIRASWCSALLMHGLGHTLLLAVVDRDASALSMANLLEHRSGASLAGSLLPFAAVGPPWLGEQFVPWIVAGDSSPWKIRLKATGGVVLNLAVVIALITLMPDRSLLLDHRSGLAPWLWESTVWSLLGSNGLLLLCSHTDWAALVSGQAEQFHCGNFGFIARQETVATGELLSRGGIDRFHRMGEETEVRGAQAGGGLVLAHDRAGHVRFVGHKQVNAKRGNLTQCLESSFSCRRRHAVRAGFRPLNATLTAAWHYRFGTSGPPTVLETHWHEWCPRRLASIWEIKEDRWVSRERNINHRITHNGDLDGIEIYGSFIDYPTLGLWLERVLHVTNRSVGDSAKIAGMMDLLVCQGNWLAAVRLGFQNAIASAIANAFAQGSIAATTASAAPSPAALRGWAAIFESCFVEHASSMPASSCLDSLRKRQQLQTNILTQLRKDPDLASHSEKRLWEWIEATIQAFLYNDPEQATRQFLAQARGSFGLVTLSTLTPDQVVLGSLGQPISIGFDPHEEVSLYASEPAAIDAVLSTISDAFRVDLNQNTGEVAILSYGDLKIYSMSAGRHLYEEELVSRRITYRDHSCLKPYQPGFKARRDPVAADLRDIPRLLLAIKNDWISPSSPNRHSAEYFANFLVSKARNLMDKQERLARLGLDASLAKSSHVDLLITGVENSLRVGMQFGNDLATIFPLLNVKVLSSNQVLQNLQHDLDSLGMAKQSIVLAITQSGQTFPTRQVIEAFDLFVRQEVIREIFLLTGEPTSFIGCAILQPTFSGEPFCRRLFINGSGRRTAEPATATVAAMHHTLTELLFHLCRQIQVALPDQQPLGMTLSRTSLLVLENMEDHLFIQSVSEIMGVDVQQRRRSSPLYQQIIQSGKRWALHVLEAPLAWTFHALYVLITVGWAIPFGSPVPLMQTLWNGHLLAYGINTHSPLIRLLSIAVASADLGIYIFGPWIWTLGLRLVQRRQLLARTGKRSVLIGEAPWVHHLLTSYVSKLFALSYGITSLEIHGANPQDELVHEHAHRVVRGSLLFLGVPDGRCSQKQRSAESAFILAGRQANGIQNLRAGPEVVVMGSNPAIANNRFAAALVLPSPIHRNCEEFAREVEGDKLIESLRESRFGSFRRLLASYVFFWSMARKVASFPLLSFDYWKSQSRTKVMTTAAPISAARLDCPEQEEVAKLRLPLLANRDQS